MYELEIRRQQNGETVEVVAFPSREAWEEVRKKIVERYGLQRLRPSGKRPGEVRYGGFDEVTRDYVLVSRQVSVRPEIRALKAARRVFVGGRGAK